MAAWALFLDLLRSGLFAATHVFGGNLGLGIIAFSVAVRLCLTPWTLRAARRSIDIRSRLKAVEPRIQRIRTAYARDPKRMQAELARAYHDAGVNPFRDSGIGMIAVQVPIGLGLYSVIRSIASAGHTFLWVSSLARPDFWLSAAVGILTMSAGLSAPDTANGAAQALLPMIFGLVSFLVVFNLSAGLALYWGATSGVGIMQNVILRRSQAAA